jgi:hypothetical protein
MANDELDVSVQPDGWKVTSEASKQIKTLRERKRKIDKEIKNLSFSVKDEGKLEEWKMIHTLKQEVIGRLKEQGVSWKKFVDTPDWFDYAYYKQTGGVKRLVTSLDKPSADATKTDEATMITLAAEQRTKIVRRKKRNTKKKTDTDTTKSGKGEAQKTGGVV